VEETYIVRIYRKERGLRDGQRGGEVWDLIGTVEDVSRTQTSVFRGLDELWGALRRLAKESVDE
jgi:hypothetical protein